MISLRLAVIAFMLLALVGCSPLISRSPVILVDDRIPSDALIGLMAWQPVITPHVYIIGHDTVVDRMAHRAPDDVVLIAAMSMHDCPMHVPNIEVDTGVTYRERGLQPGARICVDTDRMRASGVEDWTAALLTHELGHALGIDPHVPNIDAPSIMTSAPTAKSLSCADWLALWNWRGDFAKPEWCR